jgi:hypothetical protein
VKKVFARYNQNRRDPNYGKVEIQIREYTPKTEPTFTTTGLTTQRWCIQPVVIDGIEALCGQAAAKGQSHGWFCPSHQPRYFSSESAEAWPMRLDTDNIKFIIGQDRRRILNGEAVQLGRFRGWFPLVHDIHDTYESDYDEPTQ